MASDWIKMRVDLFTHPKVVRISSSLKADTLRTVGGLMSAWCLFDAHSVDGKLPGYTPEILDTHLRWPGFSEQMIAVGWLVDDGESLGMPSFEAHNGQSAKRRAQDADRKRDVRKTSASEADKMRTREEKRREEKKEQKPARSSADADDAPPMADPPNTPTPPADLKARRSERLAQVTDDAIETFNASRLTKANGGLVPNISPTVGREKRQQQVNRCIRTAKAICQELFGKETISRDFWVAYWDEVLRDDHASGRSGGGKDHPNWVPDFEYLTREATMLKLYDRAASEDAA